MRTRRAVRGAAPVPVVPVLAPRLRDPMATGVADVSASCSGSAVLLTSGSLSRRDDVPGRERQLASAQSVTPCLLEAVSRNLFGCGASTAMCTDSRGPGLRPDGAGRGDRDVPVARGREEGGPGSPRRRVGALDGESHHWVRDMTFDEDRSQNRKGNGPRLMASLRDLAIRVLRIAGASSIAKALRWCARHVEACVRLGAGGPRPIENGPPHAPPSPRRNHSPAPSVGLFRTLTGP